MYFVFLFYILGLLATFNYIDTYIYIDLNKKKSDLFCKRVQCCFFCNLIIILMC